MARARAEGVDRLICIGTGVTTSAQARGPGPGHRHGRVRAAGLGVHRAAPPRGERGCGRRGGPAWRASVAAGDGAVVAVGECGLDYYYEHSPRQAQRDAFAAQIAFAHAHGLALVIHARDAWADLFDVLDGRGRARAHRVALLHRRAARKSSVVCDAGMFVSFSGIVTFKNAQDVRDAAARCPLDRLLVETDSPFLAPVPHRGPDERTVVPSARR